MHNVNVQHMYKSAVHQLLCPKLYKITCMCAKSYIYVIV